MIAVFTLGAATWLGDGGRGTKAVVYLGVMLACVLVCDVLALALERWRGVVPADQREVFPVRRPRRETLLVLGCAIFGLAAFSITKALPPPDPSQSLAFRLTGFFARLISIALVFPVIPAIVLLIWGFRPRTLGFVLPRPMVGVLVAVVLQAMVIGGAFLVAPGEVTWSLIVRQAGEVSANPILAGMWIAMVGLSAAVPEEFFRLITQTRLGALVRNQAAAWVCASVLWALMHVPGAAANQPAEVECFAKVGRALAGAIMIVPIGLMWSYVAWRLRSLWPAILMHATNVWGLQNL